MKDEPKCNFKNNLRMEATPKKIAILLLVIITSLCAVGQAKIDSKLNQIKTSPIRLLDLVNPGVELSYERFYAKHYSSQVSLSYLKDFFKVTPFNNYKGFRISFEEKYFINKLATYRPYYAGELIYLKTYYNDVSSYIKDTALRTPEYNDTFSIAKQTLTFNVKYGVQMVVKKFVLDICAGIGVKYKMSKRSGINDINAYEVPPRHFNTYYLASKNGNYFTFNLPICIKIGFVF